VTVYYLSGPMTGHEDYNYKTFDAVEDALNSRFAEAGADWKPEGSYKIINPAHNFNGEKGRAREEYMHLDIGHVLGADIIVLLPGWDKSEGAKLEIAVAKATGKKFMATWWADDDQGYWKFADLACGPSAALAPRADVLEEAKGLITGDRNNSYGPPTQDFKRSADALNAYGYRGPAGRDLQPHDVAIMVMSVKLSRLMWTPAKRDSWVDIAGYAGCGYECATVSAA
jgi:hypothetical protein